uniref:F-box domain-containing protein n=1 Tax=Alexandrium catenella TaxID=2925 RepID=A0A7S1WIV0_ALECA
MARSSADGFSLLPEPVLSRMFSCMLQRNALLLAALSSEWPQVVAANLRRLLVTPATPMGAVAFAKRSFGRLREVIVDGYNRAGLEGFLPAASSLLEALRELPLEKLVVRCFALESEVSFEHLLNAALSDMPSRTSLRVLQLEHLALGAPKLRAGLEHALRTPGPALVTLGLGGCDLRVRGTASVLGAICEGPLAARLESLDLSVNNLGQPGAKEVAKALPRLVALRSLHLPGNALGLAGARELADGLARMGGSLVELDVGENGLCAAGVEALGEARLRLQSLSLRRSWIGSDSAHVLPRLLATMGATLTKLDLAENKLGPGGMRAVLEELPPLPELRALDLSLNPFATADFAGSPFRRLAEAAPSLEELNLFGCCVGVDEASAQTIGEGLGPSLRSLYLGATDLRHLRLAQLLRALPTLPALESFGLVQSRLDDVAAEDLAAEALFEKLPKLQVLDILGNLVGREAGLRLQKSLRRGPAFRQLRGLRLK